MVFVSRGYEIFENVSNISQLLEEQKEEQHRKQRQHAASKA